MSQMNALGAIGGLDPLALGIDLGGQLLGLPPEIRNAAKIVAGVISGDLICAANGAIGLMGNLQEGGTVEWHASSSASASIGYASESQTQTSPGGSTQQDSMEVSFKYQQTESASANSGRPAGGDSSSSAAVTSADLSLRAAQSRARSNGKISERAEVTVQMTSSESASSSAPSGGSTQGTKKGQKAAAPAGPEEAGTTEPSANGKGRKPEFDLQMYDAMRVIWENYDLIDVALNGIPDGKITPWDMEKLLEDADTDPKLAAAIRFFLKNKELCMRILSAEGRIEDEATWSKVVNGAQEAGVFDGPGAAASGSGPSSGSPGVDLPAMNDPARQQRINAILADGKLTSTDRLIGVASELLGGIDGQLDALTTQLGDGELTPGQLQKLTTDIQRLMSLRSQMHSLISQIMQNENEMAMRCINNL